MANPKGDPALVKKYISEDGPAYHDNGKWTGGEKLLTIATNADPGKKTAEVVAGPAQEDGLQAQLPQGARRTRCTRSSAASRRPRSRSARTSGWFKDFTDPQSMLEPTFNGDNINRGQRQLAAAQQQAINDAMAKAALEPAGERAQRGLGRRSTSRSSSRPPAIPWIWDSTSCRVQGRQRRGVTPTSTLGPLVHLAEVGRTRLSHKRRPAPRRTGGRRAHHHAPPISLTSSAGCSGSVAAAARRQLHHLHDLLHAARRPIRRCCAPAATPSPELVESIRETSASTSRGTSSTGCT